MDKTAVLLTIMAGVVIYLCFSYKYKETFLIDIKNVTPNGTTNKTSIMDDKVFADVKEYQNDDDGRLGLDKCLEHCKGGCVEFGVTGVAYCFPRDNQIKANYNTTIRSFENETEDVDRSATRVTFPALR